jgi:glutaconate CoA-transferase subunit B
VLVVPRQSRRNLVPEVQIVSTQDPRRTVRLISDLGVFELGATGARLLALHPWVELDTLLERTGFEVSVEGPLPTTPLPDAPTLAAIRAMDPRNLREQLVGA